MKREACCSCGSDKLTEFLDLGESPIADAYTSTSVEESETHPLRVAVCAHCHLVQLLDVIDSKTLFGTGYSFYSSSSTPLSRYHKDYAHSVIDDSLDDGKFVLEVGCNDGDMLRWFASPRLKTLGVDPASGPVSVARERGLKVLEREFTLELARELRDEHGPADVIIANHVLAHVEDVNDFLHGVQFMLADDGVAYIEVQYVGDLLVNNAFDLVYHEHRNFFSLTSMSRAVAMAGLVVTDVQFTQRQQGSIRVQVRHHEGSPYVSRVRDHLASEYWLRGGLGAYNGMQGRVERVRARLWDLLTDALKVGRVCGYGAPAKATTLLNFCDIDRSVLDYVVDSTPAKQGRYIPGTGVPIISPDPAATRPETFLLLAWNYLHEIVPRESTYELDDGHKVFQRWIIPLPGPVLL